MELVMDTYYLSVQQLVKRKKSTETIDIYKR